MLVGRDSEIAALGEFLAHHRLVTVTGVGGVGKTALARAVAAGAPPSVTCELAEVGRPDEVADAVAATLGFPSLAAALLGTGRDRRLLVLDNCEHVRDAAADTVERLLDGCAELTVLATSREPLDLPDERVVPLSPLALPSGDDVAGSPAVDLLLTRARDGGHELVLDGDGAAAVAALCRRLDGLPLALELAAARTRSLTPAEILAHLDSRHAVLGRSRGPRRHRSLDAAIGWSYDRLPEPTARFFDRLGVFAGRFTADEARAVAGDAGTSALTVADRLDHLVGQSLITVRQQDGRSWYGLLETLRSFARTRLVQRGEFDEVHDRWVDRLVEQMAGSPWGTAPPAGSATRSAQTGLLDALRWCAAHDRTPERAGRLVRHTVVVVHHGARPEPVIAVGEDLLRRWPDPGAQSWPEFAAITAFAHMVVRSTQHAAELARAVIAAGPSPFAAVLALRTLYFHDLLAGRPAASLRWAERAIALADDGDEPGWASEMRTFRASALAALNRLDEAGMQAEEAHARAVTAGSGFPEALASLTGTNLLAIDDPDRGRTTLTRLARRARAAEYPLVEGPCHWTLAGLALRRGDTADAARNLAVALEVFARIGHAVPLQVTLRLIAELVDVVGHTDSAAALREAAGTARTLTLYEWAWRDRLPDLTATPVRSATMPDRRIMASARRELAAITDPVPARFRLDGAVWSLSFAGRTARLPDAKGLHDLATLLSRPGREVRCTELLGAAVEQPDTGEVIDAQARRSYEARVRELQEDLTEAEGHGDRGRAEAARTELDLLVDQLTAAAGLGGRPRRSGGSTERARSAVTQRIRAALRRIDDVHPALGRHLRPAVRTGTWCCYGPEHDVGWEVSRSRRSSSTAGDGERDNRPGTPPGDDRGAPEDPRGAGRDDPAGRGADRSG
ncbi:hypothetical protein I4I73_18625 [Pseudonocardia sp. KRD-184]|uniref:ATPase n=1 Tax=Pseudonocardia oceani TaxID=2792013 RepID=A0ABS6UCH3_9PSEU|nr:hypothetical protein [Pseudonocardia oceani]MBW0091333.1 hypothetical protein [Pseudonocardia oceani]MBW0097999.1 hypothetical protein [Pseudonocardia oceani]MBW0110548.1 hypothetical protein [Pseudonocardia oceani]MBW0124627.1 hypothetical protein [Pseudonocardia oceani]MBW0129569.1 hypothetical protein [Pseudonocardia oceani]